MKFNPDIKVYGDITFRDKKCPSESAEQITFFNQLRKNWPDIARLSTHVKNEGKKSPQQALKDAREGLTQSFADIVIIGNPTATIELKRADHTCSSWQKGQQEFLIASKKAGAFSCVALGHKGALLALKDWIDAQRR